MLEKDMAGFQQIIEKMGQEKAVEEIRIIGKNGRIWVASDRELNGRHVPLESSLCKICHEEGLGEGSQTVVISEGRETPLFRFAAPIPNRKACHQCHDSKNKLNGILFMDFLMGEIYQELAESRKKMVFWAAVSSFVMIGVVWVLMNRTVLRKILAIATFAGRVEDGDLSPMITFKGNDEMTDLANHLNRMTGSLKHLISEREKQTDYLETLIDSIGDGLVVVDRDLRVVAVNQAYLSSATGKRGDIIGSSCRCMLSGREGKGLSNARMCPAAETFKTGKTAKAYHTVKVEDGEERFFEIFSSPIRDDQGEVYHVVEVLRDITERKQLEAQLIHSDRLATLGLLASQISHEINTPLASISACIEGLQKRMGHILGKDEADGHSVSEYLNLVRKELDRCKGITQELLNLASRSAPQLRDMDINQTVLETASLIEWGTERGQFEVSLHLDSQLPPVLADESQVRQVILNIALNGIQAMKGKGRLHIRTARRDGSVHIIVEDEGCGISKENLSRIFNPFYSTKPHDRSTGLGLPICESIVRRHGGEIRVTSEVGQGTRFDVVLPIQKQQEAFPT
jgi:PAS domain S-box-containing protein